MVPKCELPESIPLHGQRLNYLINVSELEDHVGERGWNSNWPTKLGLAKKNFSYKFCQSFARERLNQIHFSLCPIAHHEKVK